MNALTNVYLGRCDNPDGNDRCTTPRGEYTDFNVWLEDLSDAKLVEWTTCL